MPRYYLHVYDDDVAIDPEGVELPDDDAARDQAIMRATAMMAQSCTRGFANYTGFIEVEDDNRQLLFTVSFLEASKS